MSSYIRYLKRKEINEVQWNQCIDTAKNGLIYGYSYYLDQMAVHWDGLVLGDYECVMPLTWNRKYGFYYLYQPPFTASLGVFGTQLAFNRVEDFITAIPARYKLIEIDLNYLNRVEGAIRRMNYVLPLNRAYDALFANFRESTRRNIKKALQFNCRYSNSVPVGEIIKLSMQQSKAISKVKEEDYVRFRSLFDELSKMGKTQSCGVYNANNELVSSCVYFFSNKRAYYILVGNHPNSKALGSSHYLIDRFIYDHAGTDLLLDFEGSDLRNLAFFYSSFGAVTEEYPALRINRLPWWARMLK